MESTSREGRPVPTGRAIVRGFAAAHGALAGALWLALMHVPLQVANAIWWSVQDSAFDPGQEPNGEDVVLAVVFSAVTFALGVAVFFAFPFIPGGILGQVRDRLEAPARPPESFGRYARAHYPRLLGSQALFLLITMAVMAPVMFVAMVQTFEAIGTPPGRTIDPAELNRQLLQDPVIIVLILVALAVLAAVGLVYWMANCAVVAEQETTLAAWRRGFAFCRRNAPAVLAVWLINLAAGAVLAPPGMLGQLGVVSGWGTLAAVAVLYAAATGYWGVVLAGLCMSLFLGRRRPAEPAEPAADLVGASR